MIGMNVGRVGCPFAPLLPRLAGSFLPGKIFDWQFLHILEPLELFEEVLYLQFTASDNMR
jgi:hypothetical protein